jgi:hypothetical protein
VQGLDFGLQELSHTFIQVGHDKCVFILRLAHLLRHQAEVLHAGKLVNTHNNGKTCFFLMRAAVHHSIDGGGAAPSAAQHHARRWCYPAVLSDASHSAGAHLPWALMTKANATQPFQLAHTNP